MEALVPGNNPAVTAQSSYDQEHNEAVEVLGRRINFALIDHNYMVPDDIPVGDDLSISFSGASTGQREAQSLSHVSKRMPVPERKELHDNCRYLQPLTGGSEHWFSWLEHSDCSQTLDLVSKLSDFGKGTVLHKLSLIPDIVKAEAIECTINFMTKLRTGINLLSESIQDGNQYPQQSTRLFYVGPSKIHKQGVFASQDMEKRTTVGPYAGTLVYKKPSKDGSGRFYVFKMTEITSATSEKHLAIEYLKDDTYVAWCQVKISGTDIEIGISGDSGLKYLNHSKKQNVFLNVFPAKRAVSWSEASSITIDVIALRAIHCDEELMFDYDSRVKEIDFSINCVILPDEPIKQEIKRTVERLSGQKGGRLASTDAHRFRRKGKFFKSNPSKRISLKKQSASKTMVQASKKRFLPDRTLNTKLKTQLRLLPKSQKGIINRCPDGKKVALMGVLKSAVKEKIPLKELLALDQVGFGLDRESWSYYLPLWQAFSKKTLTLNSDCNELMIDLYNNKKKHDHLLLSKLQAALQVYWVCLGKDGEWKDYVAKVLLRGSEKRLKRHYEVAQFEKQHKFLKVGSGRGGSANNIRAKALNEGVAKSVLAKALDEGVAESVILTNKYNEFVEGCKKINFSYLKFLKYCGFWQDLSDMSESGEKKLNINMASSLKDLKHDIDDVGMDLTLRKRMYWTNRYFFAISGLPETDDCVVDYPSR